MIDGSVLQSAQRCFEKKSRVVVKMVVNGKQSEQDWYKRIYTDAFFNQPQFISTLGT